MKKDSVSQRDEDGFEIADFFIAIWNVRKLLFSVMVLTLLASLAFISFMRIAIPVTEVYKTSLNFLFDGARKGKYPNGVLFAPTDLISANILKTVYRNNKLSEFGMTMSDFMSSVSIRPYSVTLDSIIARYEERLNDKKISFVERKNIENEMEKEIKNQSANTVLLSLFFQKEYSIPKVIGEKILNDIPKVWAQISIEQLGVIQLPTVTGKNKILNIKDFNTYDYLISTEVLTEFTNEILRKSKRLKKYQGITTVIDAKTKLNFYELQQELKFFSDYKLRQLNVLIISSGLHKNIMRTKGFFQSRMKALEIDYNVWNKKAEAAKESLFLYDRSKHYKNNPKNGSKVLASEALLLGSTSPQVNEGFINKIIELTRQREDLEFRQKLVQQYQYLYDRGVRSFRDVKRIKAILLNLEENVLNNVSATTTRDIELRIQQAVAQINDLNKVLFGLYETLSLNRFPEGKKLYKELLLPSNQAFKRYHPIINKYTFLFMLFSIVAVTTLTLFISLIIRGIGKNNLT